MMLLVANNGILFRSNKAVAAYQRIRHKAVRVMRADCQAFPDGSIDLDLSNLKGRISVLATTGESLETESHNAPLPLITAARTIGRGLLDFTLLPFDSSLLQKQFRSIEMLQPLKALADFPTRTLVVEAFSPTLEFWAKYNNEGKPVDYLFLCGYIAVGGHLLPGLSAQFYNLAELRADERFHSAAGYTRSGDLFIFPTVKEAEIFHAHIDFHAQVNGALP
ncbi:MAG: hypothetical protein KKD13_03745 [Candidatus Margulisbacteria bacterium]|nr:hypothetical protein [Candidatus Margulisiibacteriota bacterium]